MTTRDLILRAEQYANKENADFYSYAEKVAMLNESYVSLYQFLLNTGDKYWVKEYNTNSTVFTLPYDCYQISGLYVKIGNRRHQVFDYELKNNKVYVKNGVINSHFILEYYPTPTELTYKDVLNKCPFNYDGLTDINQNMALIAGATHYSIYDTVTKKTYETALEVGEYAHIYNDGNVVSYKDGNYKCLNIGKNIVIDLGNVLVIYNNSVYYKKGENVIDVNGNIVSTIELEAGSYITDFTHYIKLDGILPINNYTYIIPDTDTGVTDGQKVYTQYAIKGYYNNAFLTKNSLTSVYFIESLYNDVEISYPNNIFYTVLAIDIALKMRSKQGVDNSLLNQQYIMARTALFNSIEKNKGSHVKIKDVYEDYELGGIYN